MRFLRLFTLLALFSRLAFAQAQILPAYNEAYDANGKLRPHYQSYIDRTQSDPLNPSRELIESLTFGHPLGDNIKILPVPLILDDREYQEVIAPGVNQRARALSKFFEDRIAHKLNNPVKRLSESLA